METTWDGMPVAPENPTAVAIVIWRRAAGRREFLILHRHHGGPEWEGDWAWTPPAGARRPDEARASPPLASCGKRPASSSRSSRSPHETDAVALFVAEAHRGAKIVLDAEHDRFEWVTLRGRARALRPGDPWDAASSWPTCGRTRGAFRPSLASPPVQTLRRTPLYDQHVAAGARMVPFAGWEMPVQYAGVIAEHRAVRTDAGVFDVSQWERSRSRARPRRRSCSSVLSNDVAKLGPGEAQYKYADGRRRRCRRRSDRVSAGQARYLLIVRRVETATATARG